MAWIAAAVQMLMVLVGDVGNGGYIQVGAGKFPQPLPAPAPDFMNESPNADDLPF